MKTIKISVLILLSIALFISCDKDDDVSMTGNLNLNINGLEDLGPDFTYEGWVIVDGAPVATGTFNVDVTGKLSKTTFALDRMTLEKATTFVLTIEPVPDADPAPSKVHILGGDISAKAGTLSVEHAAALGTNFANSTGKYILATPTNNVDTDENSGVWFLDNSTGSPMAGLNLPTLPEGWQYEGWAVINGTPVTTGKFTSVSAADMAAPFSGTNPGPNYPGEDFLMNAPSGLTFPTDLSGAKIVISVEPMPDNSAAPFLLKPLLADVPADAAVHSVHSMGNISTNTNPGGSVNISIN
ncbi:hypothetical protein SAMN05444274_103208 [Mariniphaga anaerophila]|uniref:Anti-sigma-K factor rskA n=1 Tax=Mariniphaga anaerophila TaxID=1484053 RepID=A0A1M4Y2P0_9BACT|nr:anti-sigma factor [Mariniphaga anaerophila]SHF00021.1 hypothetical protein SAMN05444274_103208 [Mariniphaga anaerophila]